MVLSLTASGIESAAIDSGTYTWANVVALNSPFLITHSQPGGKDIYRWLGDLRIKSTAKLLILNQTIEFLSESLGNRAVFGVSDFGIIQFDDCEILISKSWDNGAANELSPLTYAAGGDRSLVNPKIYLYNSVISTQTSNNSRINLFISELKNSLVYKRSADAGFGTFIFLQPNGTIINAQLKGVNLELAGSGTIKDFQTKNAIFAFLNYTGARQTLQNVIATSSTSYDLYCADGSPLDFIDSTVDLTKCHIQSFNSLIQESKQLASHFLVVKSSGVAVSNIFISYEGRTNISGTTASDGKFSAKLVHKETNLTSLVNPGTGNFYAEPTPTINYNSYVRQIRGYLNEAILETIAVDSQVGSATLAFAIGLITDSGITQPNQATAAAVTGITHTATTITISASRSIAEIYDSRKAFWRDNGGTTGRKIGATADFGNLNITLSANAAISPSNAKFLDGMQTSGIITLTDARAYNGIYFSVATGGSVLVSAGNTDLRTWAFVSGTTINRSGMGSAIVTVSGDQLANVIAGVGVTIQAPLPTLTVMGFQPLSNITISQGGQTLRQLNSTSPPFTWEASGVLIPSNVSLTVVTPGFEIYTQTVSITNNNQSVTVAQIPSGSSDAYNGSQIKFQILMISDLGFKRILNAASGLLLDDAANCRLAAFENTSVKTSWNLLVATIAPTAGEIATWQGYLTLSGYTVISFSSTGVVS